MVTSRKSEGFLGAGNGLLLGLNAGYTVMPCPKIQPAEHLGTQFFMYVVLL